MEKRVAYWTDFGITHCNELYGLQKKLAQLRLEKKVPDIIVLSEHYPVVSFGRASKNNRFSRNFLERVRQIYNDNEEQSSINLLNQLGIDFFREARGGGATYLGPGQLITYPIVDFWKVVNTSFGVNKYKNLIDQVMYEILRDDFFLDVKFVEIPKEEKFNERDEIVNNRADVWVSKNEKNYKIGATGIHTSNNVAYNGFSIFVKPYSLYGFDFVDVCGYDKEQLDVTCIENELNKEVGINKVKEAVLRKIKEKFNYEELKYISQEDLEKIEAETDLNISAY